METIEILQAPSSYLPIFVNVNLLPIENDSEKEKQQKNLSYFKFLKNY